MREWYKNKVFLVLCHVVAWIVFFSLPTLLRPDFQSNGSSMSHAPFFSPGNLVMQLFLVTIFYLHAYYLIPRFLNRQRIVIYILMLAGIIFLALLLRFSGSPSGTGRIPDTVRLSPEPGNFSADGHWYPFHRGPGSGAPLVFYFFTVAFVLAVSMTYRFVLDKLRLESLHRLSENEHLKTELSFLRSQISPHFIFNILNSAVSLARTGSNQLENTLIKLSNLLRYMLYSADDLKVPLTQEIEYLESYIDLQKIRFEEDVTVTVTMAGTFTAHVIEPMLLIPFVENAFKHGIGRIDNPAIFIHLQEDGGILNFQVRNRFNPSLKQAQDKNSGIGLANVKKRLQLLYDDKYTLEVNADGDWFDTKLNLVLK